MEASVSGPVSVPEIIDFVSGLRRGVVENGYIEECGLVLIFEVEFVEVDKGFEQVDGSFGDAVGLVYAVHEVGGDGGEG